MIAEAVSKTVVSNSSLAIPEQQLNALKVKHDSIYYFSSDVTLAFN